FCVLISVADSAAIPRRTTLLQQTATEPPSGYCRETSRTRIRSAGRSSRRSAADVRSSPSSPLVDRDRHDLVAALGLVDHAAHPLDHASEAGVAAVEVRLRRVRDKELRAAGVGAGEG